MIVILPSRRKEDSSRLSTSLATLSCHSSRALSLAVTARLTPPNAATARRYTFSPDILASVGVASVELRPNRTTFRRSGILPSHMEKLAVRVRLPHSGDTTALLDAAAEGLTFSFRQCAVRMPARAEKRSPGTSDPPLNQLSARFFSRRMTASRANGLPPSRGSGSINL